MQGTQITVESVFISIFTMNNIASKLQKCWTHKTAFKIIPKILQQPNFFNSQPSTLRKEALAKFYLSMTFGLRFMVCSAALYLIADFLRIFNPILPGLSWSFSAQGGCLVPPPVIPLSDLQST